MQFNVRRLDRDAERHKRHPHAERGNDQKLEQALRKEQVRLLERAFNEVGEEAVSAWLAVNQTLAATEATRSKNNPTR